jgi:signal transduction histidine kinase
MNAPDADHTLRNQLAIILGYAELLLQDAAVDDPRREDFEEIHKAAKAAIQLMSAKDEKDRSR